MEPFMTHHVSEPHSAPTFQKQTYPSIAARWNRAVNALDWIRTNDFFLRREALYPLSY